MKDKTYTITFSRADIRAEAMKFGCMPTDDQCDYIANLMEQDMYDPFEHYAGCDMLGDEFHLDFHGMKAHLKYDHYLNNGSIAVYMECDEGNGWEPWANLTVNLNDMRQDSTHAYIDVNNLPWALKWLKENELIEDAGKLLQSRYCMYPLMKFTEKFFAIAEKERW